MLNPVELYEDAGQKAAEARNQGDEARARHHELWFRKARDLESGDDRHLANQAYKTAYEAARNLPKAVYFR